MPTTLGDLLKAKLQQIPIHKELTMTALVHMLNSSHTRILFAWLRADSVVDSIIFEREIMIDIHEFKEKIRSAISADYNNMIRVDKVKLIKDARLEYDLGLKESRDMINAALSYYDVITQPTVNFRKPV